MTENNFELEFTEETDKDMEELRNDCSKKTVAKAALKDFDL